MIADFTIRLHKGETLRRDRDIRVVVHDSLAPLRAAAARDYNKLRSKKKKAYGEYADTCGICQRFHMSSSPLCAIIRLAPPHLGIGVVAHELCHATVWIWEIENKFVDTPLTCENDEWFCWINGELVRQTVNKLYQHGVYPNAERL